jgi:hypothetical protein
MHGVTDMPTSNDDDTGGVTTDGTESEDDGSFLLGFLAGLLGGIVASVFALRWVRKRNTRAGFLCGVTVQVLLLLFALAQRRAPGR